MEIPPAGEEAGPRPAPDFRWDGSELLLRFIRDGALAELSDLVQTDAPDMGAVAALADSIGDTLRGMDAYHDHPYRGDAWRPSTLWTSGSTRLLDYGGAGSPVLVVPSMINRSSIMDLSPALSRMRWLAARGYRPFLFDWGEPGAAERHFDIGDFLTKRLAPAFDAVSRVTGQPVHVMGYCMGGPIALALAAIRPDAIGRIVMLGTPWDFRHFPEHEKFRTNVKALEASLMTMGALFGGIPAQVTHSFFALRDLASGVRKYARFARMAQDSEEAVQFVAIEDWLNNGVTVPLPVALECFSGWLVGNALARGDWQVSGAPLDVSRIYAPVMVVAGTRDSVVPPSSAMPLVEALGTPHVLKPATGHIGIILGPRADDTVWQPILRFLDDAPEITETGCAVPDSGSR